VIDVEAERPKFEAQFIADGWPECVLARDANGFYIFDSVTNRFAGWLAAKRDALNAEQKGG
jgi:hypothetical protein